MHPLTIELTKLPTGGALLKCTRADGSVTWQRNEDRRAAFFAFHDLRHYAVESVLGYTEGFYGLIAFGWDISDTTGKGPRGCLPDEASAVEHLVGMLDADSTNQGGASAAELNQYALSHASQNRRSAPRALTDESLREVRTTAFALHREWTNLSEGATMRLLFPRTR
jgi:hypothetical protein